MYTNKKWIEKELKDIQKSGLYKNERIIQSQQDTNIDVNNKQVLNFCANNYLGLSSDKEMIKHAKMALEKWGFGLSSVRFICGTQPIHKKLEEKISTFLEKEDTILYTSCFDANGGLFETLLNNEDIIISDALNHASIIDGVRLCKARCFRYSNSDMNELEKILIKSKDARFKLITTDGAFSMDGFIAKLDQICLLAEKYNALVHVDDSHATGIIGKTGKGSAEYHNVMDKIDIITSTFGKALGGASGGFTSSNKEIIKLLRQRSRPYLFSNSLPPMIAATTLYVLDKLNGDDSLIKKLEENTKYFRCKISETGLKIQPGTHPIVPVMIGNATLSKQMAHELLNENIYVTSFSYPVVPKGEARIRVQISASHTKNDLNKAIDAFTKIGESLKII